MFPFDNTVSYFDITGANLKLLLIKLQNGEKNFYPQWGLSHTLRWNSTISKYDLIDVVLADGSPIVDTALYTGVTIKFLLNGGDDFKNTSAYFTNIV